ncbi:MAG TPA: Asp-tRNA(Asn)/Glu-tRNA(Gln) amidotransferase subunit GatC [Leptospiraceae bacterium]|jgi:aspartyl/glutamyl-tRNA(Asn/Gln) amidotransferase C subunit|nr:Asp-tRNA(Asn)/Glu-tRNA(Gln) amidotransferase subunit GatC [Leptospirales bacterium]HMW59429.1 Asp-tRNA(Asn)/Glu-tRNA(Gln) amidotransferase subunit GatC [Leptospiraceae bacterium]HMX58727.1 Asp-tRNA(Asn)/Glu-tRNA(Gln) amidotransferase subunit GatC [Leptospiraceae bacterium]HNE25321.1 Asp-tRNA(Asn)/Glu-tRNA(Gln) amidotransferase subunit GatC [Leptospiraceae bacterium]HNJ04176.1 Asp-tRNA(Asn)/Glu-tRNA(Gln) amidotransferase subunit GatC [Leptospiraceae bacterium]
MLSEEQFSSLAFLARLDPEDAGLKGLRMDFNKILDAVKTIEELDLHGAEGTSVPGPAVTRPDEPVGELSPREISKFAPEWEAGHFVVPGVIQSE